MVVIIPNRACITVEVTGHPEPHTSEKLRFPVKVLSAEDLPGIKNLLTALVDKPATLELKSAESQQLKVGDRLVVEARRGRQPELLFAIPETIVLVAR